MPAPPSSRQQETNRANAARAAASRNTGPQNASTPGGAGPRASSPSSPSSRPSSNSGNNRNNGISTPTASGSPVNNPTGLPSRTSSRVNSPQPVSRGPGGGISTPNASGSPLNNPVSLNPMNGGLRNAMIQRQAVNSLNGLSRMPSAAPLGMGGPRGVLTTPQARPDPRSNVGVIDAPRLMADPTNGIAQYPGAGVPNLPVRGQTVYKTPGPRVNVPSSQPVTAQNYGFQSPTMPQAVTPANNIPTPRQNPLSDINKFNYPANRPRDYVFNGMDQEAISRAVRAQELFGAPVTPTSGMRNPLLNKKVGGAKASQHMLGKAIDLGIPDTTGADTARLIDAMQEAGFTGIGGYRPGKVHGDIGPLRSWGPNTRSNSISQLPSNMRTALLERPQITAAAAGAPPKKTVASVLGPVAKKGLASLKNVFAENIPVPRSKPGIPSTVAPATSVPRPQEKPRVPSIVAPSRGAPIPREKPTPSVVASNDPTVSPAGWSLNDIPGVSTIQNGLQKVNTALDPIAEGIKNYGVERTQNYVTAKMAALMGDKKLKTAPGGRGDNRGLRNLPQTASAAPTPVEGPTPPMPGFTWVQWTPGSPPVQIPTNALIGAA